MNRFGIHNLRMATDRHQAPSYPLRMPDELKERVQEEASRNGRSLHAELLRRIEGSFEEPDGNFRITQRIVDGQRVASSIARAVALMNRLEGLRARERRSTERITEIAEQIVSAMNGARSEELEGLNLAIVAERTELQATRDEIDAISAMRDRLVHEADILADALRGAAAAKRRSARGLLDE